MPKKRSNGEGTLHKRPNGLWECTIMIDVKKDGSRLRKSFYGHTQKEVKEKVRVFREKQQLGIANACELTFQEWAEAWYLNYKGQVSDTTYEGYRYTLNKLEAAFGEKKLVSIRTSHVEKYLKEQQRNGLSNSYITKIRALMFQIMKKAVANDLINKNPVEYADKLRSRKTASKKDSFTREEIDRMNLSLPNDRIGNSIRLMLGTGMRTQEILALEVKHIEPDGSVIHIRQAVTMVKGTAKLGPPKTKTSYRDIPVPEKLRSCAKSLRYETIAQKKKFIWFSPKGKPFCNPSWFRKLYHRALAGIPGVRDLSPHCCRHTYVSQLQAAGVPMETIQALSGHADIDMTEHYLHVQQDVKFAAAETLNTLF